MVGEADDVGWLGGELLLVEGAGALDDLFGELGDAAHEFVARELAGFDFAELVFPFASEGGAGEFLNFDGLEEVHEGFGLGGGDEVALGALEVAEGEEVLDDGGAGGGGAEAFFLHGVGEVFILDEFAGAFHGGEEGGFGVARGRAGDVGLGFDFGDVSAGGGFALVDGPVVGGGKRGEVAFDDGFLAVNGEPARDDEDFAFGFESVAGGFAEAGGDVEFSDGVEGRDEAAGDHIVDFGFVGGELVREFVGGDDGEVVGDLGVIEEAFVGGIEPAVFENLGGVGGVFTPEVFEGALDGGGVVFGEGAGVGARVGDGLVFFVKGLGEAEGFAGGEAEAGVGLALEGGKVVKARGDLGGMLFLFGDGGVGGGGGLGVDFFGSGLVPEAVGAVVLVVGVAFELGALEDALVETGGDFKIGEDAPVVAGDEGANFVFAVHDHGEGGSLDAAHGGDEAAAATHAGGEGAGAVDADEPVGLGAAAGGFLKGIHGGGFARVLEGVANGLLGHGGPPKAAEGLLGIGELVDVGKDELALAAGVAGVEDGIHILASEEFFEELEAFGPALGGLETEGFGDDGEVGQGPAGELGVNVLGHEEFDEVADGGGEDVVVALEEFTVFLETAERARDVGGDAGLFGDDQGFSHEPEKTNRVAEAGAGAKEKSKLSANPAGGG